MVVFNACDPMEDIYDEIDENVDPVNAEVSFTFTTDDYAAASGYAIKDAVTSDDTTNAENIEDMEAFNMYFAAEDYVPYVIEEAYGLLKDGSVATVTYNNYIGGLDYLDNFGSATAYELVDADYEAMGPGPGGYHNFSSYDEPEDYLPDWLLTKYPDAEADDMVAITYDYYSGHVYTFTDYYSFDGNEWSPIEGVYVLSDDDYDSMGDPGAYNNFSSSAPPSDYLPAFLKIKFPYAQSGDVKVIVYKYYSGSTNTYAKEYHYDGTDWTEYDAIEEVTNQFIHNGEGWVFDPTETYTMGSSDFQLIVDYVEATFGESYIDSYGTQEFYYGAGSYYNNFDTRSGKWNDQEFDSWEEAVEEALATVLLPEIFPNATILVNGVDMFYVVVYDTYSGADATYSMRFKVTTESPLAFELVDGPNLQ